LILDYRITRSNGIEVVTESLLQQLSQAGKLLESQKLSDEALVSRESACLPILSSEVPSVPLPFTGNTPDSLSEPIVSSELVTTTQC